MITNPFWVLKTRWCLPNPTLSSNTAQSIEEARPSLPRALHSLYKNEGIRGFYRGIGPALFGVTHGAIQFSMYETFKASRLKSRQSTVFSAEDSNGTKKKENASLTTWDAMWMAALSKVLASITTYPYQVVKSRLQVKKNKIDSTTIFEHNYSFSSNIVLYKIVLRCQNL